MSVFTREWLSLREPYDSIARNRTVLQAVADHFTDRNAITVADLGCGTGSTFRAINAALPAQQTWRMYDRDVALMAGPTAPKDSPHLQRIALDLADDLEYALVLPVDLVTASALLDLVSNSWAQRLAVELSVRGLPFYAALTYDGKVTFSPEDHVDSRVISAVNRHQMTDKGFGPALGPNAASFCIRELQKVGYEVVVGQSNWEFTQMHQEIQLQLLAGWASAAATLGAVHRVRLEDWLERRRAFVNSGRSTIRVGHMDFFARPMTTR